MFATSSLVAVLGACAADPVTPIVIVRDVSAPVQTDSLAYQLRRTEIFYEGRISLVFTNRDTRAVEITNCNGFTSVGLEKLVGERWVFAWSPVLADCLSRPIVVAPGATFRAEFGINAGRPGTNAEPKFEVSQVDGVYRVVWGSLTYVGPGSGVVPASERTSNRFALIVR